MVTQSLVCLGFPEALSEHLSGAKPIKALSYRCAAPSHSFSSSLPTNQMQPLWECGTVVTYFNVKENVFEACSLEAVEEKWFSHRTAQSVLAHLLLDLYEDEVGDDELAQVAVALNFKHFSALLAAAKQPGSDYWSWRNSLAEKCG